MARQADLPQQPVHYKGHSRHIAGILQNGEEEKQHQDGGQKGQHAAYARQDTVNDKGVEP